MERDVVAGSDSQGCFCQLESQQTHSHSISGSETRVA